MLGLRSESDILYNPVPLYHMAGGIVGTCCALIKGIPSVLRVKFSVSAYWTDCIKYNCTVNDCLIVQNQVKSKKMTITILVFAVIAIHRRDMSLSIECTTTTRRYCSFGSINGW